MAQAALRQSDNPNTGTPNTGTPKTSTPNTGTPKTGTLKTGTLKTGTTSGRSLADLEKLAKTDIETGLVANLSQDLHRLFDPVSHDALPIYFGPLLGRLYLEGL